MSTFLTNERARRLGVLADVDEDRLSELAAAASALVERHCKRRFALSAYLDEEYEGDGTATLFLRNFPVVQLDSLKLVHADGWQIEIPPAGLVVQAATGRISFRPGTPYGRFVRPPAKVMVSYTAGFDPVPGEVIEAAAQTAAWLYSKAERDPDASAERLGDYARDYTRNTEPLPAAARALVATYRSVRV